MDKGKEGCDKEHIPGDDQHSSNNPFFEDEDNEFDSDPREDDESLYLEARIDGFRNENAIISENGIEDELLKLVYETMIKGNPNPIWSNFATMLLNHGLGTDDYEEYLKQKYSTIQKERVGGPCRAVITKSNKFVYRCLDCLLQYNTIMCTSCFEHSNHKGHRIWREYITSGVCDCGDADIWKPSCNCSLHTGFVQEDDVLDAQTKENFRTAVKKGFSVLLQLYEDNLRTMDNSNMDIAIQENAYIVDYLVDGLLEPLEKICSQYPSMAVLISRIIDEPLPFGYRRMFHLHDDYSRPQPPITEKEECTCTILKLLLRYTPHLEITNDNSTKQNQTIENFLVQMYANIDFKKSLAVEFMNHYRFYFKLTERGIRVSNLVNIDYQLIASANFGQHIFQNAKIADLLAAINNIAVYNVSLLEEDPEGGFLAIDQCHSTLKDWFTDGAMLGPFFAEPAYAARYFSIFDYIQRNSIEFDPHMDFHGFDELLNMIEDGVKANIKFQIMTDAKLTILMRTFVEASEAQRHSTLFNGMIAIVPFLNIYIANNVKQTGSGIAIDITLFRMFTVMVLTYLQIDRSR